MMRPENEGIGFYGKLPLAGDFIKRILPDEFVLPWDLWLQAVLVEGQKMLGELWLDYYLTCPVLRFAIHSNVITSNAWLGVLMCSVDKVGRCFPFTLAAPFEKDQMIEVLYNDETGFFRQLESIALSGLDESNTLVRMEQALQTVILPEVRQKRVESQESHLILTLNMSQSNFTDNSGVENFLSFDQTHFQGCSFWINPGSEHIDKVFLCCRGLPSASDFSHLIKSE